MTILVGGKVLILFDKTINYGIDATNTHQHSSLTSTHFIQSRKKIMQLHCDKENRLITIKTMINVILYGYEFYIYFSGMNS
jgi:hypothetical protein